MNPYHIHFLLGDTTREVEIVKEILTRCRTPFTLLESIDRESIDWNRYTHFVGIPGHKVEHVGEALVLDVVKSLQDCKILSRVFDAFVAGDCYEDNGMFSAGRALSYHDALKLASCQADSSHWASGPLLGVDVDIITPEAVAMSWRLRSKPVPSAEVIPTVVPLSWLLNVRW